MSGEGKREMRVREEKEQGEEREKKERNKFSPMEGRAKICKKQRQ